MSGVLEHSPTKRTRAPVLVSNPGMKFVIGLSASLCAVFSPRLIAALASAETNVRFFGRDYLLLAAAFSALVAVAVMFLEWDLPRAPRDTFAMTLGLPAILAGALSTTETGRTVEQLVEAKKAVEHELSLRTGIQVEHTSVTGDKTQPGPQGALITWAVTPVYAQSEAATADDMQSRYGVYVDEARYFVVIDRSPKLDDAKRRMTDWTARLNASRPSSQPALGLTVERIGNQFLVVVTGGPLTKSSALIEALRVKDVYHVTPTLVEAESRK